MKGLLLINLGTPDAPTTEAVRRYLREFLSDPRVLDIGRLGRWALLNLVILSRRPARSAAAYRQIWGERGSPLLVHGLDLTEAVRARLSPDWRVELGMRYRRPSIGDALDRLRGAAVDELVVLPLYPQYASSSTGSSLEEVDRRLRARWPAARVARVGAFYADPGFIDAVADVGGPILARERPDHVLFSFHGVPERHIRALSRGHCLAADGCCDDMAEHNQDCYRAQCFATAKALVARLGLASERCDVGFQSRLGRAPWIRPHTDLLLPELARRGRRRLVVFCPSFVADCLETLEEIGIRARDAFLAAGGEALTLVPSLNASPAWADAVASLARRQVATAQRE